MQVWSVLIRIEKKNESNSVHPALHMGPHFRGRPLARSSVLSPKIATRGKAVLDIQDEYDRAARDIVDKTDENFSVSLELIHVIGTQP